MGAAEEVQKKKRDERKPKGEQQKKNEAKKRGNGGCLVGETNDADVDDGGASPVEKRHAPFE